MRFVKIECIVQTILLLIRFKEKFIRPSVIILNNGENILFDIINGMSEYVTLVQSMDNLGNISYSVSISVV